MGVVVVIKVIVVAAALKSDSLAADTRGFETDKGVCICMMLMLHAMLMLHV